VENQTSSWVNANQYTDEFLCNRRNDGTGVYYEIQRMPANSWGNVPLVVNDQADTVGYCATWYRPWDPSADARNRLHSVRTAACRR
jgi:hypothetical protein